MLSVPGHERETAIEGGCGDQRIKGSETVRLRIGLEEVVGSRANAVVDVNDGVQINKAVDARNVPFVPGADYQSWAVTIAIQASGKESTKFAATAFRRGTSTITSVSIK